MPIRNGFLLCKIGLSLLAALFLVNSASAYIGPGAGLELTGHSLKLLAWALAAFSAVLLWPLYALLRALLRWRRGRVKPSAAPPTPASPEETPGAAE